jgi:hypothetical protein
LVVIAIMAIIAAMLFTIFSKVRKVIESWQ